MRKLACFILSFSLVASVFPTGNQFNYSMSKIWLMHCDHFNMDQKTEFYLGCWSYDIWMVSSTVKEPPQLETYQLSDIFNEKKPFEAGRKFTHYLNSKEREYFSQNKPEFLGREFKKNEINWYVKLLEDLLCYDPSIRTHGARLLNEYLFTDFNFDKLTTKYPLKDLVVWYFAMYSYFSSDTNPKEKVSEDNEGSISYRGMKVNFDDRETREFWEKNVFEFAKNPSAQKYFHKFKDQLTGEIHNFFK